MTTNGKSEAINILLSREELLYVLNILQAQTIPGLDADPLGQMDGPQHQLALVVAERALRARELAISHNGSGMVVHNALLTAVGVSLRFRRPGKGHELTRDDPVQIPVLHFLIVFVLFVIDGRVVIPSQLDPVLEPLQTV